MKNDEAKKLNEEKELTLNETLLEFDRQLETAANHKQEDEPITAYDVIAKICGLKKLHGNIYTCNNSGVSYTLTRYGFETTVRHSLSSVNQTLMREKHELEERDGNKNLTIAQLNNKIRELKGEMNSYKVSRDNKTNQINQLKEELKEVHEKNARLEEKCAFLVRTRQGTV